MDDSQYRDHCLALLRAFADEFGRRTEGLGREDSLRELAGAFRALADGELDLFVDGPGLISRLFVTYPDFAPTLPRDLLWYFGGECLHYMPDAEIATFQQLDELRAEAAACGKVLDLAQARASLGKTQ